MPSEQIIRRAEFEQHGVEYARLCVARGNDAAAEASAWLAELKDKQELDAASKRDAREEETLSIAKEANRLASEANAIARLEAAAASRSARYAMYAAIIAAISAAIAAKDEILNVIFK